MAVGGSATEGWGSGGEEAGRWFTGMSDGLTDGYTLLTAAFLCCAYSRHLRKTAFVRRLRSLLSAEEEESFAAQAASCGFQPQIELCFCA